MSAGLAVGGLFAGYDKADVLMDVSLPARAG
jgi:hypothetical protein